LFEAFQLDFPQQYPVLLDNQSAIAFRRRTTSERSMWRRSITPNGNCCFQHQATQVKIACKRYRRHRDVILEEKKLKSMQTSFRIVARCILPGTVMS
jgi:hypothetical protein